MLERLAVQAFGTTSAISCDEARLAPMPTTRLRVAYRPIRVAWIVRGRSKNDLIEAIVLATCFWGGEFSLIMDVGGNRDEMDEVIRCFRADRLEPVGGADATAVFDRNSRLRRSTLGMSLFDDDEPDDPTLVTLQRALRLRTADSSARTAVVPQWEETDPYS